MTITSGSNSPVTYTGNGSTDTFSAGTNIFYDDTDLIVTETVIATGVETTYVKGTDYTVTGGNGSTGSITLTAGNLPSTKRVTIEVSIPYAQSSDYVEGEAILADELETSLDKAVLMTQQNKALVDRSLKFTAALSSGLTPVLSEAPADGKALVWSGAGGTIANADFASLTTDIDTVFTGLASDDFLQYNGSNWVNKTIAEVKTALDLAQNNYTATTAPGVGDDANDGYSIGSQWYDGTNDNMYHCLDATVGAAVWVQGDVVVGDLGSAAVATLIDDDTMATATASNIPSAESVKAYVDNNAGGLIGIQYYTSGATWTKPAGCNAVKVICIGGGGEGESSGGTTGTAGGTSSFGSHVSCTGGGGGQSGNSGGTASNGDINIDGQGGGDLDGADAPRGYGLGGKNTFGVDGTGYGAGGSGGNTGGSYYGGGSGAYAEKYIDSGLGATETVTVGAGGGGATNGGDGSGGLVIVEEYG